MVAAAVVAGVASVAGSAIAGSEAAGATKYAANAAIAEQNQALAQQAALAAPYTGLGQSAIPQLQSLLGLQTTPGLTQPSAAAVQQALAQTPGYQFTQQQGTQNTLNAAAAQGMALSGNTLEGLSQFNAGLADQTYQQAVGNLQNTVGLGQAAAAGQAANIGNAASNISSTLVNQGNTLAGIDANTVAGITKGIGNAANNYVTNQTLKNLYNSDSGTAPVNPYLMPSGDTGYNYGGIPLDAGSGLTVDASGVPA